ncbi:MAG: hypothetical protein II943_12655 [Victivallales bacterium]|nr:hypothetical protein [Victivallales bacterium]
MPAKQLHVIVNTHIDPVWIWSRRSGRNAWLNSVASNLAILREAPELKFVCSASALYRWVEECAPALFREIQALVAVGRWELVGGWEVQSDAILARLEPLLRQGQVGKEYFQDRFGVDVKIGYNVDAFGHTAGLPQLLNATGFTHYCFMRPQMPSSPVFTWKGPGGSEVTALNIKTGYGIDYAMDEAGFYRYLDSFLSTGEGEQALFFGVGDHGGGIYRRHLEWFRSAMSKGYPLRFSTLGEYFQLFEGKELPVVEGELGPFFRGCYSANHTVKALVARATRRMLTAEKLGVPENDLAMAWRELLFQHFHDILPGTSVRAAYEKDVFPGLGSVSHTADTLIDRALAQRASHQDTRFMEQGGIQIWNPHPHEHLTLVAVDNFSDPNATGVDFDAYVSEDGEEYPIQYLPPPTSFGPCGHPWQRFTAAIPVAACAERYLALAHTGRNYPPVGFRRLHALQKKLSLPVYYDNSRTWGFGLQCFDDLQGEADCMAVEEYQNGPVCAILRSRWRWRSSTVVMDLTEYAGLPEIGIRVRLDWHEPRCALKLAFAHGLDHPDFAVGEAGAVVRKLVSADYADADNRLCTWNHGHLETLWPQSAESVFVDWCAARDARRLAAVFAPDLHSCDHAANLLRITLIRPVLYADHYPFEQNEEYGWADLGLSWRQLWFFEGDAAPFEELPLQAQSRLENGEVNEVTAHDADETELSIPQLPAFKAKTTMMTSARLQMNRHWKLTLKNYGPAEELQWTDGTPPVQMPAEGLLVIEHE